MAGTHPPSFSPVSATIKQLERKHRGRGFDAAFYLLESDYAIHMTGTIEVGMGPQSKINVFLQSK